jgi:ATP-binding cassette subfamily F protein 3
VTASETGDGNAITAIAKDMDDNKKKVDQLYEEWEKVSAELEAAKDKYPI